MDDFIHAEPTAAGVAAAPEPATWALVLMPLVALLGARPRRKATMGDG